MTKPPKDDSSPMRPLHAALKRVTVDIPDYPQPADDNDLEQAPTEVPRYLVPLLAMIAHSEDAAPEVEPDAPFDPP